MQHDPELEADVQAWLQGAYQRMEGRGAHMLRAPRPLMNCLHCNANLRGKSSGVQTLGMLRGRFWRWHKCPFCNRRFVAGVSMGRTKYIAGSTTHVASMPTSTEDVERLPQWYPRALLDRLREAEVEAAASAPPEAPIGREVEYPPEDPTSYGDWTEPELPPEA